MAWRGYQSGKREMQRASGTGDSNDFRVNKAVIVGFLFAIAGVVLIAYGWLMDTSVPGNAEIGRVHNLSLGQRQMMFVITGGIALLAGILLAAAGAKQSKSMA